MARVTVTDKGYKALVKRVFGAKKARVEVGIPADVGANAAKEHDGSEGPATLLDVAIWNEFGTEHIPARSFIRAWVDENKPKLVARLKRLMERVVAGKLTPDQALEQFGQSCQRDIQARMAQGIPPPNAPATVAIKGSSKPLIDTGQLRSSITYRIKKGAQARGSS